MLKTVIILKPNLLFRLGLAEPGSGDVPTSTFRCTSDDARWTAPCCVIDDCPECGRETPAVSYAPGRTSIEVITRRIREYRGLGYR